MMALSRVRLPRSTDFGKAEPARRCAQKPVRSARRAPDNDAITAVADDRRADFDKFLLPTIEENERVAGFIPIGHADDPRGDRARPLLANNVMRL
jgi:hypothetical protein